MTSELGGRRGSHPGSTIAEKRSPHSLTSEGVELPSGVVATGTNMTRNNAERSALPGGTVTFLFTDIEGSTRLAAGLGERYAEVLADHQRLLRDAFAASGGREVDTQGDAFFVVFPRAKDGVAAALVARSVRRVLRSRRD